MLAGTEVSVHSRAQVYPSAMLLYYYQYMCTYNSPLYWNRRHIIYIYAWRPCTATFPVSRLWTTALMTSSLGGCRCGACWTLYMMQCDAVAVQGGAEAGVALSVLLVDTQLCVQASRRGGISAPPLCRAGTALLL